MKFASYTESADPHQYHFLTMPCIECGSQETLTVLGKDLYAYNQGKHIQDAFPYLTASQRERFITGICGKCFDAMFKEG